MFWRTVLLCLLICSLSSAYFHLPQSYMYDFSGCTGSTCRNGQSVGYGCINGNCTYACSDGFCSGYQGYQHILPPISHQYLVSPWGHGAIKRQEGCHGGNCGYWGGCVDEYCGGYYDFRGCMYRDCLSGPFRGYGCRSGNCQVICLGRNCYIVRTYGMPIGKKPKRGPRNNTFEYQPPEYELHEIQKEQPGLEDIGETFEKKDMWMLKNLNATEVFTMVKSWINDEKVFSEMKPNGDEVIFILNEFRKRNRMQARLELWREAKKNQLYMNVLCPYRRNQLYQCPYQCPYCPYQCPGCPGGCQPQPPMIPYQSCPHQQCPYHQWPPKVPHQSPFAPPNYYKREQPKPWVPPQSPFNCPPGGCQTPKPPQPWSPPQVPYKCPGGCPAPKPPLPPPPVIPPPQHWVPPQSPFNCPPGGCQTPKPPLMPPPQPWSPPQVPYKCPGGCPAPKPPSIPAPNNPPPQPWSPPQVPYNCPGGCPAPKPPSIPAPINPPPQPWSPPQVPYNCPGGCPAPKQPSPPAPINPTPQSKSPGGYYKGPLDPNYQK